MSANLTVAPSLNNSVSLDTLPINSCSVSAFINKVIEMFLKSNFESISCGLTVSQLNALFTLLGDISLSMTLPPKFEMSIPFIIIYLPPSIFYQSF